MTEHSESLCSTVNYVLYLNVNVAVILIFKNYCYLNFGIFFLGWAVYDSCFPGDSGDMGKCGPLI